MTTQKIPSNFPKLYNGQLNPEFNYNDFIQQTASIGDLSNYANLFDLNVFLNSNIFQSISVTSLNNIPASVLSFLSNVKSDIQNQLDNLLIDYNNLSIDVSNIDTRLNTDETDISNNILSINLLNSDVSNINQQLVNVNTDLLTLQNITSSNYNSIQTINGEITTIFTDISNNQISILKNETDISNNLNLININKTDISNNLNSINTINQKITNLSYDQSNNLSIFNDNLLVNDSFSVNGNANLGENANISSILNVQEINTINILSNQINSNQIFTNSLYLNNQPLSITGLYLYCNVKIGSNVFFTSIPILKTNLVSNFGIQNSGIFTGYITIFPNYRLRFYDNLNNVLFDYKNTSQNIIYFYPININGILYKLNFYYNDILI